MLFESLPKTLNRRLISARQNLLRNPSGKTRPWGTSESRYGVGLGAATPQQMVIPKWLFLAILLAVLGFGALALSIPVIFKYYLNNMLISPAERGFGPGISVCPAIATLSPATHPKSLLESTSHPRASSGWRILSASVKGARFPIRRPMKLSTTWRGSPNGFAIMRMDRRVFPLSGIPGFSRLYSRRFFHAS